MRRIHYELKSLVSRAILEIIPSVQEEQSAKSCQGYPLSGPEDPRRNNNEDFHPLDSNETELHRSTGYEISSF
jgi:hypothetical protein